MTLDGRPGCGSRHSVGLALACAAWLSLSPPLLAEDATAADEDPGSVVLVRPRNGAAVEPGKSGAGGKETIPVAFSWHLSRSASLWYFVEVIALGPDEPREAYTGYTRQTDLRLRLAPGRYAWRVLAVDRSRARYSVSAWSAFTAGDATEAGP